jgi:hypothetical protein
MRTARLVFSLLVTLSGIAAALTYVQGHTWRERIYLQGHGRSAPDYSNYNGFRDSGSINVDTIRTATGHPDPYLQRYYSQSEGWTYYTLPSYSSGH